MTATAGIMALVYTIVAAAQVGWATSRTLLPAALTVLLLGGFVLRQATAARPLLPLTLLRLRRLVAANIVQFLTIAGMFGLLFYGTLYLQRVLRYSALQAGIGFVPIAVVIAAVSLGLSARLGERFGQRRMLLAGLVLIVAAFVALAMARVHGTYLLDFLPASLVMGLGFGLAAPAMMGLGMDAVTPADSGVASGLFNTTQQVGGAIGLAALSALTAARTAGLSAAGSGTTASLLGGYHAALLAAAGLVLTALLVAAVLLRSAARPLDQEGRAASATAR